MFNLYNIKRVLGFIIILAFIMPLSQCTVPAKDASDKQSRVIVKYAYSKDTLTQFNIYTKVTAFFWPLIIFLIIKFRKNLRRSITIKVVEIILCIGTVFVLVGINVFAKPLYGSYVAGVSTLGYGLITLYEAFVLMRKRKRVRKSKLQF